MHRSSLFALLLCSCAAVAQSSHPTPQPTSPSDQDEMAVIALPPVQFGSGDPVGSPPSPPQPVHGPVRISGGVMAGLVLNRVAPIYPAEARANRISGTVVFSAKIGKDGTVQDLRVISGPPVLADAAMTAVRQWTYRPYQLNGNPTEVNTTVTVNFNLNPPADPAPQ